MPYDTDGTVVGVTANSFAGGITSYPSGTQLQQLNDYVSHGNVLIGTAPGVYSIWFFFPGEQREVTAFYLNMDYHGATPILQGSNDTTNGTDGTWETASLTGGWNASSDTAVDAWRAHILPISFTGPKKVIRIQISTDNAESPIFRQIHLYGEKASGQTPDDILFLDSDDGGAEFTSVEDFGDRPLGTTVTRQFKVKNSSATKTASGINIQCNDSDFAISTDGVTWVVTINISSLGPGVSSSTMYVRNTTPGPGGQLGTRHARVTASGYTFA